MRCGARGHGVGRMATASLLDLNLHTHRPNFGSLAFQLPASGCLAQRGPGHLASAKTEAARKRECPHWWWQQDSMVGPSHFFGVV